jgi:ABC-type lipoprotein release transport system permease subunit
MVKTALKIAWRYLFAKKQFNAIHIITAISSVAVGVVTAAMICILSVMNGFGVMVEQTFSQFDPDIRITAKNGKSFHLTQETKERLLALSEVNLLSESIEETALIYFEEKQTPVCLVGVDSVFESLTKIDQTITDGHFEVYDGGFDRAVLGQLLAWKIGIGARFIHGIQVYAPKRNSKVNMLRPDANFNQETCFIAGIFAVNQQKYDENMMIVDIDFTRRLFEYDSTEVTAIMVSIKGNIKQAKRAITQVLGNEYYIHDRYEQQADFFRILHIEKLLTAVLLAFILLIATFNSIGALSMLIIDKKNDIHTLSHLGADTQLIRRIFFLEGWLVNIIGAIGGMTFGLIICLLQEHFGLLKLGNGVEYIISAYPIKIQGWDILLVMGLVLILNIISVWIPVRKIKL